MGTLKANILGVCVSVCVCPGQYFKANVCQTYGNVSLRILLSQIAS